MAKKVKEEPKQEEKKVEEHHKCEICGENAVCLDSPSTMKDTNHWYCQIHHEMWYRCISHEKMLKEYSERKTVPAKQVG